MFLDLSPYIQVLERISELFDALWYDGKFDRKTAKPVTIFLLLEPKIENTFRFLTKHSIQYLWIISGL
jgi:hypothetical protein